MARSPLWINGNASGNILTSSGGQSGQSDVTVRFEYKQEKLKAFVQAKEQTYKNVNGTNRSEFRVIGDEYFDDGQVLAWRCLLIEHGRIVAEKRSFLWDKSV